MTVLHNLFRRWISQFAQPMNPAPPQWYAWDAAPWDHPFLTVENLRAMRAFSDRLIARLAEELERLPREVRERPMRFAFTGNMANDLYQKIRALSLLGVVPDLVMNPQDTYLLGDPRWEEFDGSVPPGVDELNDDTFLHGRVYDLACRVLRPPQSNDWGRRLKQLSGTYRAEDLKRWPEYFSLLPVLECLRGYDAVLGTQVPFVPYLANMPYLLAQSGSDIRVAANRGDSYGALHRIAYHNCKAFLARNPWSIAHARRLGMVNAVILPVLIDETIYKPGPPTYRREWQERVGGDFFVLCTSRLNDDIKGSSTSLEGFVRFARRAPDARLVVIAWGQEKDLARNLLSSAGLMGRTVFLPLSGKRRLISYLRSADCLLDQFVMRQLGSTAREALACGLPVVMSIAAQQYDSCLDGKLPVLDAKTSEEIASALEHLHRDSSYQQSVRDQSRNWFLQNLSGERWGESYEIVLRACALGLNFDYSESPLQCALSEAELEHYRIGLARAPVHPI